MFFWGIEFLYCIRWEIFEKVYFPSKQFTWDFFNDEGDLDSSESAEEDVNDVLVNYFLFSFFSFITYLFLLTYIYPTGRELYSLIFDDMFDLLSFYFNDLRNINKLVFISADIIAFLHQYHLGIFSKIDFYVYIFYDY